MNEKSSIKKITRLKTMHLIVVKSKGWLESSLYNQSKEIKERHFLVVLIGRRKVDIYTKFYINQFER
jgi:hypothetical protein